MFKNYIIVSSIDYNSEYNIYLNNEVNNNTLIIIILNKKQKLYIQI